MIFFGVGGRGGGDLVLCQLQKLVYDSAVRLSIVLLLVQFVC